MTHPPTNPRSSREESEALVAGWMARLEPLAPSDLLRERVLAAAGRLVRRGAPAAAQGRSRWAIATVAAACLLGVGLLGLAREASRVGGVRATDPSDVASIRNAVVVDDPRVPLFHGLDSFDGLDASGAEGTEGPGGP